MNFKTWLENDAEHAKTLKDTGFWGKQGAGSIVVSRSTGRILLPHRSGVVQEPNTWGVWGGAIDADEDPKAAAKRELEEEAGYKGSISIEPLSVFQKNNFKYYNFLAVVEDEFKPKLNWETQGYIWTDLDKLPQPLHFGLEWVLSKDYNVIKKFIELYSKKIEEMASFTLPHAIKIKDAKFFAIDMKFESEPKTLDKNGHVMNQGSKFLAKMPDGEYLAYDGGGNAYFVSPKKIVSLLNKGYKPISDDWYEKAEFIK